MKKTKAVEHPIKFGFKLGLKFRIGYSASANYSPIAKTIEDVVYVALFDKRDKKFKEKEAIKIGQTKRTLKIRWDGTLGIFNPSRKLRPNEKKDSDKWLKLGKGKKVVVWMKKAGETKIEYDPRPKPKFFSTRGTEEEFLDNYYKPKLGMKLNREEK